MRLFQAAAQICILSYTYFCEKFSEKNIFAQQIFSRQPWRKQIFSPKSAKTSCLPKISQNDPF
jgi:hypothetical protein